MRLILSDFDTENFELFLEKIRELKEKEPLDIYIDSSGGDVVVCNAIIIILEKEKEVRDVTLYSMCLLSSGFELFYRTKVNKVVLDGSYAGLHYMGWNINLGNNAKPRGNFERFKYNNQKKQNIGYDFLTEDELKIYNEGEIVYLDADRLREIL